MRLQEEVAGFVSQLRNESVEQKKSRYIAEIFSRRPPPAVPASVKRANLFQEAEVEGSSDYVEYQRLCRAKEAALSKGRLRISDGARILAQCRRVSPRIVSFSCCRTRLGTKSLDMTQPEPAMNRQRMTMENVQRDKAEIVKKLRACLQNRRAAARKESAGALRKAAEVPAVMKMCVVGHY